MTLNAASDSIRRILVLPPAVDIAVGSERLVGELTQRIKDDGYQVLDGPRRTGDGFYESVVVDPDSNRIEMTV
jgi:lactoylglutathione lyase